VQYQILLQAGQVFQDVKLLVGGVCPLLKSTRNKHDLFYIINCQLTHVADLGQWTHCQGLKQCMLCRTRFAVTRQEINDSTNSRALEITAWKNLGPFNASFEILWRSQIWPTFSILSRSDDLLILNPGSIRRTCATRRSMIVQMNYHWTQSINKCARTVKSQTDLVSLRISLCQSSTINYNKMSNRNGLSLNLALSISYHSLR